MNNHTGTHILNFALREVLGDVDQKGSLVAPDRLRFDFTAKTALSIAQVKKIEEICVQVVQRNESVYAQDASLALARQVKGLRAVFEETYPDPVRIVSIGVPVEALLADPDCDAGNRTSVEFCGGTHLHAVGHIGDFVITTEEAIAKGIRRIVALTGDEAKRANLVAADYAASVKQLEEYLALSETKTNRDMQKRFLKYLNDLTEKIGKAIIAVWRKDELRAQLAKFKKHLNDLDRNYKQLLEQKVLEEAKQLSEKNANEVVIVHQFDDDVGNKTLDLVAKQMKHSAVMVFSVHPESGKVLCLAAVAKDAAMLLKASEWVKDVCTLIGGKGGGRDTSAQASGDSPSQLEAALKRSKDFALTKLKSYS
jgi:alanyl-tRNA synthetase